MAFVTHGGLKTVTHGGGLGFTEEQRRAANATVAKDPYDFRTVCDQGSVSNAAAYRKPYKFVAFSEGDSMFGSSKFWSELSADKGSVFHTDPDQLSSINVVACLARKTGTEVKSGTCDFESDGKQVSVDQYAVQYDVVLHEAKTGKSIKSLGPVNGPANECPILASFDSRSPKIYAPPDKAALERMLAQFAG